MRAALEFLDVTLDEVTVIRDNRLVDRLHVVQQASEIAIEPAASYLRQLTAHTPAKLDRHYDGAAAAARLYVSRSRILEGGMLLGERYLEQSLEADGWRIFHPQERPLVGQMQAYYRADVVMFASGSACHGAELFGAGNLRRCILLPRGHAPNTLFEPVLRPRSQRYDALTGATMVDSVIVYELGLRQDAVSISILNMPAFSGEMRALQLAYLPAFSAAAYRQAALRDLASYIAYHRLHSQSASSEGWRMVAEPEVARLIEHCTALLG